MLRDIKNKSISGFKEKLIEIKIKENININWIEYVEWTTVKVDEETYEQIKLLSIK